MRLERKEWGVVPVRGLGDGQGRAWPVGHREEFRVFLEGLLGKVVRHRRGLATSAF